MRIYTFSARLSSDSNGYNKAVENVTTNHYVVSIAKDTTMDKVDIHWCVKTRVYHYSPYVFPTTPIMIQLHPTRYGPIRGKKRYARTTELRPKKAVASNETR
jgi:hypothetical protein